MDALAVARAGKLGRKEFAVMPEQTHLGDRVVAIEHPRSYARVVKFDRWHCLFRNGYNVPHSRHQRDLCVEHDHDRMRAKCVRARMV